MPKSKSSKSSAKNSPSARGKSHDIRLDAFIRDYNVKTYTGPLKEHYGKLILYKAVRKSFAPWWTPFPDKNDFLCNTKGAYKPGMTVINGKGVDTDPYQECSYGLHVTSLKGARNFAKTRQLIVVRVLVDLNDIMCVPNYMSYLNHKIRCQKLYVANVVRERKAAKKR